MVHIPNSAEHYTTIPESLYIVSEVETGEVFGFHDTYTRVASLATSFEHIYNLTFRMTHVTCPRMIERLVW